MHGQGLGRGRRAAGRGGLPKGDALAVARLAAIQATKRTADLIPLCHPIAMHGVDVEVVVGGVPRSSIVATVRTADRTGVEMEALTAAAVGGLAVIDMVKGRIARRPSPRWCCSRRWAAGRVIGCASRDARAAPHASSPFRRGRRRASGRTVRTGGGRRPRGARASPAKRRWWWRTATMSCAHCAQRWPTEWTWSSRRAARGIRRGTSTPEKTRRVIDRESPGLAEAIRAYGVAHGVATAVLSRGIAGIAGRTLIVNLPGSPGGARDGVAALAPVLVHVVDQIHGGDTPAPSQRLADESSRVAMSTTSTPCAVVPSA